MGSRDSDDCGAEGRGAERRFPAAPESAAAVRRFVFDFAHRQHVPPQSIHDIVVAASEAAANAVRHGAPRDDGWFSVTAEYNRPVTTLEICDVGDLPPPAADDERAMSLRITESLVDRVEIERETGRTRVRLVKRVG